jgi:hypothetical protein
MPEYAIGDEIIEEVSLVDSQLPLPLRLLDDDGASEAALLLREWIHSADPTTTNG